MKKRPILFAGAMVRAILEGRKTQTRRVVKPQPSPSSDTAFVGTDGIWRFSHPTLRGPVSHEADDVRCPYGQPGDRLWVRETWQYYDWNDEGEPCIRFSADNATTWPEPGTEEWAGRLVDVWEILSRDENYSIDNRARDRHWRPSIHMPRWASRILLEVTGVRVERLQDISEEDAKAEGADCLITANCTAEQRELLAMPLMDDATPYRNGYALLWESINGDGSWEANPWVWVVEFKRLEGGAA